MTPRVLRQTRVADLTRRLDPSVVAAAFAITEGAALWYITDAGSQKEVAFDAPPRY